MNMIEIADTSEVSRATLYNHFRDKGSVLRALLESEVERLFQMVDSDISPSQALMEMSRAISSDVALKTMRQADSALVTQMLAKTDDPLWQQVDEGLVRLIGNRDGADIARLWLIGQVLQPLTPEQCREQSRVIASSVL